MRDDDQGILAGTVFLMHVMVYVDKTAKTKQFLKGSLGNRFLLSYCFNFSAVLRVIGRIPINSSPLGHSPGNRVKTSLLFCESGCNIIDGKAMHDRRNSVCQFCLMDLSL